MPPTSTISRSSSKSFACAITFPPASKTTLLPSKTSSSLPPTWLTYTSGLPNCLHLRGEQLQPKRVLAHDERRSAGVDQHLRPGGVQVGDRVLVIQPARRSSSRRSTDLRRSTSPTITSPTLHQVAPLAERPGLKIAALIEHVVRRQQRLEMPADDLPVAQQRDRVVQRPADRARCCARRNRRSTSIPLRLRRDHLHCRADCPR